MTKEYHYEAKHPKRLLAIILAGLVVFFVGGWFLLKQISNQPDYYGVLTFTVDDHNDFEYTDTIFSRWVKYYHIALDGHEYRVYDKTVYSTVKNGDVITLDYHTTEDSHILKINGVDTKYGKVYYSASSDIDEAEEKLQKYIKKNQ